MVRTFTTLMLLMACLLIPVTASAAYNPLGAACGSGSKASQSSTCDSHKTSIVGPNGVLKKASTIIASIAGVAAVIVIMVGGLQYVISNGDPQKTANARSAIIGGAVGLGIIVAAQGIILLVLSRLQ